ncbi:MAG: acetyl-CoA carboxylase biotin carboxylase subunit [Lachnospiraceae bacterium]|nr:acetyl-CoA carboxylase biotin carboxylase subunit [Lachnospiraceae bacterium]
MFSKILVANRGEIAVRIIRACKEMGIRTVAVYSMADAEALHVALADEAVCIGKAEAADSYLNEERVVSAALVTGAQAIHPGYGFLSENAHFAKMCQDNGIVFIGPSLENMDLLSDKEKIKRSMIEAELPVIPGSEVLESIEDAKKAAKKIGYPVMVKARSGGGGRGIRLVKTADELENAYHSAVAEGTAAFGDGAVYMEKYINPAKHIEMQVIADEFGNVVCLGERDCSIQKNNQKLIEESTSPVVSKEQRDKLIEQVTRAVKHVNYLGVGTLEFLLDTEGNFYFMEMNVRLQVEHTVTEALTGYDLVKWQIRVAAGIELNFTQKDVDFTGSSIECRINAKAPGNLKFLHVPGGPFVRFDTFLVTGMTVSPYYDSLLGKLIVFAGTREEAIRKMKAALCELVIDGIPNNIEEQIEYVSDPRFVDGTYNLNFFKK